MNKKLLITVCCLCICRQTDAIQPYAAFPGDPPNSVIVTNKEFGDIKIEIKNVGKQTDMSPLHLGVYITNIGKNGVLIPCNLFTKESIQIFVFSHNKIYMYPGFGIQNMPPYEPYKKPDYVWLKPGYSYGIHDICEEYRVRLPGRATYKAQVWLSRNTEIVEGKHVGWRGTVGSNKLTINVR